MAVPLFAGDEPSRISKPRKTANFSVGTGNTISQSQAGLYQVDLNYIEASVCDCMNGSQKSHAPHAVHRDLCLPLSTAWGIASIVKSDPN